MFLNLKLHYSLQKFPFILLAPVPDLEEEFQYSGSEEEDEQLLAGMIAEEMG